ncbi:hypothetical protein [Aliamphritea ceti]|uniref:hypothetical protein n=1 Tax=Aliamphritea ceti TaxID=1524258 RepID=UPI0021C2E460|nr:hypothetical protein [Aliamphritea ceti]
MEILVFIALDIVFSGASLWVASKLVSVELSFAQILIAVATASMVAMLPIPVFGWLLSVALLFFLLKRFSDANVWPDLILLVIVGRLVSFLALISLGGIL